MFLILKNSLRKPTCVKLVERCLQPLVEVLNVVDNKLLDLEVNTNIHRTACLASLSVGYDLSLGVTCWLNVAERTDLETDNLKTRLMYIHNIALYRRYHFV